MSDLLQGFGSQATTLEELKKELEMKKIQVKNEFEMQEKEIFEMKRHQTILQKELLENDKIEKELTAEIEIAKENIADRKRKEKELSKNSQEIKDHYKNSCKELAIAQQEYEDVLSKKKDALTNIDMLKTEIDSLKQRKEKALEIQREKKKEFNHKSKQLITTEKEYLEKEAILKKEIEKWEADLGIFREQFRKEEEALEKQIKNTESKAVEAREHYLKAKNEFDEIRKARDIEIGGPALNDDKYKEHDHLIEEIYRLEGLLEMQRLAEEFFIKQSEELLKAHETRLVKEHEIDLQEVSEKRNTSEEEKKKLLQRKKTSRYGTAEHFMLRKIKAEIDLMNQWIELSKNAVPTFSVPTEIVRRDCINAKVMEIVEGEQHKLKQDEQLYDYVEMMRLLKVNKRKEEVLKKAIDKVSAMIGENVSDIVQMIDENPFDDYPLELKEESTSNGSRPFNDDLLSKSRLENVLPNDKPASELSRIVDIDKLLNFGTLIKEKDIEIKWLETKRKLLDAYTKNVIPNLRKFEEVQSNPESLTIGYQTVYSSPFHYIIQKKDSERAQYLDKLDEPQPFYMIEEPQQSGLPLSRTEVSIKSDRNILFIDHPRRGIEINVREIIDILPGFQTRMMIEKGDVKKEMLTFSILTETDCINIEIKETQPSTRDFWLKVFLSLMFEARNK
ncbi:hypothetical protein C9374_000843 [Naegleria lovaniensis]|uniref:Uncharacterized protein n=1 Tax=Naegleria lovaniensis TaxID=51637 RepID=A0AA88GX52_NAELO|nr:uncharacterized protein C9374_000843 [Naegleria lovaniensis]KAG2387993.1 hypothetical protein C9374_000843 [Naegleria lovaniensis]